MSAADDPVTTAAELRVELAEVLAELAALPRDAFAARAPLLERRDLLSRRLREQEPADPEVATRWAERAVNRAPTSRPYRPSAIDGEGMSS